MISGHGSQYSLEADDQCPPNPKRYSLREAKVKANKWFSYADTIGGCAKVVHLITSKIIHVR